MPDILAGWARTISGVHFHYMTTTPEQVARNYMAFTFATYPVGSFVSPPLSFLDVKETLSIRKHLVERLLTTFPRRKFVLIADTSNLDVMSAYPQLAKDFPDRVQCIWIRNTSATDPSFRFPYHTAGFKDLEQSRYMFFRTPDDLAGLNVSAGNCYNQTVRQNLTFGLQGGLFGTSDVVSLVSRSTWVTVLVALGTGLVLGLW